MSAPADPRAQRDANDVHVSVRGGPHAGARSDVVRRRAQRMLAHLGRRGEELSVALVNDTIIRELNRDYRGKDATTDVLAFAMAEGEAPAYPGELAVMLGDVVISVPTARRQAARRRRPLLDELTMLLAHGLLHLLGHDHQTDEQEREMTALTRELEEVARRRGR